MNLLAKFTLTGTLLLAAGSLMAAPLAEGNASAGKTKAAVCAACHGANGISPTGMYPNLAGQGAPYMEKQLHDFKSGARVDAVMAGMSAGLSDADIADISTFYAGLQPTVYEADPELVKQGEAIFRGGIPSKGVAACAACHAPDGHGIISAKYPLLAGQHPEYIELQLKAFRAVGRGDLNGPHRNNDKTSDAPGPMESVAGPLSDMEIKQVASFISGLSK